MSRRGAWALALTATLTMAVSYVDRQTLAVLAPTVTKALDISEQAYGWLVSAFSIAYLVGAPLAGRLIDRVGARRGLLGAVILWSIVAALHALVPGFGVLFALRILLGLAEAPSFPGAAQTVHRALPPEERARGLGVLFTGSSFGAMIAPPLASALDARFGWRVAFLVSAVVGLAWIPVWLLVAFGKRARQVLDRGIGVQDEVRSRGFGVPAEATARPAEPATPWLAVLANPAVLRAILVVFASAPSIAFVLNWGAKFLVREHGLTQAQVGSYLWLPPVFFDVGAILFGHVASKRAAKSGGRPERGLFAAAALLSVAMVAMPAAKDPWTAVVVAGVAMAGGGGLFALLTADMLMRVSPSVVSSAGGITAAAQSLAYIVANPLVGASVQRTGSYTTMVIALSLWAVPGCVAWLLWRPPPPWRQSPGPSTSTS